MHEQFPVSKEKHIFTKDTVKPDSPKTIYYTYFRLFYTKSNIHELSACVAFSHM